MTAYDEDMADVFSQFTRPALYGILSASVILDICCIKFRWLAHGILYLESAWVLLRCTMPIERMDLKVMQAV